MFFIFSFFQNFEKIQIAGGISEAREIARVGLAVCAVPMIGLLLLLLWANWAARSCPARSDPRSDYSPDEGEAVYYCAELAEETRIYTHLSPDEPTHSRGETMRSMTRRIRGDQFAERF